MKDKKYRPEVQGPKIPTPLPVKPKPGVVNKPANAKAEALKNWFLGQKKGK
jgi:hypothetical protein